MSEAPHMSEGAHPAPPAPTLSRHRRVVTLLCAGAALAVALTPPLVALLLITPNPLKRLAASSSAPARLQPIEDSLGGAPAWRFPNPGASQQLLLIHGRSRDKGWLAPLIERLAPSFDLVAIDLPGHGASGYGISTFGDRERRVIRAAVEELTAPRRVRRPLIIYGVSMGGSAAILALEGWRPRRLIGLISDGSYAEIEPIIGAFGRWLPGPLFSLAKDLAERWGGFRFSEQHPERAAARLQVPLVALHGRADPLIPPAHAERLAGAAPRGRAVFYAGGHDEPASAAKQAALIAAIDSLR